jgi:hypothetical protein
MSVALNYVLRRMCEVLNGRDQSKEFAHLTAADRKAILLAGGVLTPPGQ